MKHTPTSMFPAGNNRSVGGPSPAGFVLIVEDDDDTAEAMSEVLAEHGHRARAVADAESALTLLARTPHDRVELLIADLVLAGSSGWKLLSTLDGDASLRDIPVLVTTACRPHETRALHHPILHKPFGTRDLIDQVRSLARPAPAGAHTD